MERDLWIFRAKGGEHGREEMCASELSEPDGHIARRAAHNVVHLLMEGFIERDDGACHLKVASADGGRCEPRTAIKERRTDFLFLRSEKL